jgi:HEAT repeat protein
MFGHSRGESILVTRIVGCDIHDGARAMTLDRRLVLPIALAGCLLVMVLRSVRIWVLSREQDPGHWVEVYNRGDVLSREKAVEKLLLALRNENKHIRARVIKSLLQCDSPPRELAAALSEAAIHDQDSGVRIAAALYLPSFGSAAIPTLLQVVKDQDENVRAHALGALNRTIPDSDTFPVVRDALEDAATRSVAMVLLGDMGPAAAEAEPRLMKLCNASDPGTRIGAAWALWRIGHRIDMIMPVLLDALHSDDPEDRIRSIQCLGRIGEEAKEAVPAVVALLKDDDIDVRLEAVRTLGRVALPEVVALLKDDAIDVRLEAVRTLGRVVDPNNEKAIAALREALADENMEVRRQASESLKLIQLRAAMRKERQGRNEKGTNGE